MADDLRNRVLAAVRKGLAGALDTSKAKNPVLRCYRADSATQNGVTALANYNTSVANKINDVTPLHPFSAKRDSQPGKEPTEPTLAYRVTSVGPNGVGCRVEIVELPQAKRYRKIFGVLQLRPPAIVPVQRWRQCVEDGKRFLALWGSQAEVLGWTGSELFGLHEPPATPHPSYSRLSRYDSTGLCWRLQGRPVVALTEDTASIRNPGGSITVFRKNNRPAYGPPGDGLDDFK
jgi:hypothetical protein